MSDPTSKTTRESAYPFNHHIDDLGKSLVFNKLRTRTVVMTCYVKDGEARTAITDIAGSE